MIIDETDVTDIQADIDGPLGTPYEGGVFRCKLAVELDFPNNPPKGVFLAIQAISLQKFSIPTSLRKAKFV